MHKKGQTRKEFLGVGAAVAATAIVSTPVDAAPFDPDHPNRIERALVLSGGGARGAYEAGLIQYLVEAGRIQDGQPLAPYGIVCGTSIGALNGYCVATAQYSLLRNLWQTIASFDAIRPKSRYAKIRRPDAGVGTRLAQALDLVTGLRKDQTGVIDGAHLKAFLSRYIDASRPVVMPAVWTVTNLTRQAPEFFYLAPQLENTTLRSRAAYAVQATIGPQAVLRPATPDLLLDSLLASAAIPVAFDPVTLPAPDGSGAQQYCDGGVTANTPIGIARAAARNVDVVMLDPPFETDTYKNAVEIGFAVYGTMQRALLEANVRGAYLESLSKRAFQRFSRSGLRGVANSLAIDPSEIHRYTQMLYASDFYLIRPEKQLPVAVVGFSDADNLTKTYMLGYKDAQQRGFAKFEFPAAVLPA